MFALRHVLTFSALALACADTDDIETHLQRDPPRGAVRVVSLLPGEVIDLAVTVEDEAPVAFADLGVGVTGWRTLVAGEATGWVLQAGTPASSAPLSLGKDARMSALVTVGATAPVVSFLTETANQSDGSTRVRFINGLSAGAVAAVVEGVAIGGAVDPHSATDWITVDDAAQAQVVVDEAGTARAYGPVSLQVDTDVTLALYPGDTQAAAPRLLVFHDTPANVAPTPFVLEAQTAP